jgi:hypothetical protein
VAGGGGARRPLRNPAPHRPLTPMANWRSSISARGSHHM